MNYKLNYFSIYDFLEFFKVYGYIFPEEFIKLDINFVNQNKSKDEFFSYAYRILKLLIFSENFLKDFNCYKISLALLAFSRKNFLLKNKENLNEENIKEFIWTIKLEEIYKIQFKEFEKEYEKLELLNNEK